MIQQRTLKKPFMICGVGVHSGQPMELVVQPAPPATGIVFRRIDLNPIVEIPATHAYVGDTQFNTSLVNGGVSVGTVEHLLSAFAGLGIDNAYVDIQLHSTPADHHKMQDKKFIQAMELPVLDGSALPFAQLIQQAGVREQEADKLFLKIKESMTITDGDKSVCVEPYDGFKLNMSIDFKHPVIAQSGQQLSIDLTKNSYIEEISPARTFGFLTEYDYLRQRNLALGASLDNTVVLDDSGILNPEGLRDLNEFVKHKMLDFIGDLYLLGYHVIGIFSGHKSGHALNHQLRQALLDNPHAWELVTRSKQESLPMSFGLV